MMNMKEVITHAWNAIMKTGIFIMIFNYAILYNWYRYKKYKNQNRKGITKSNKWYLFVIAYGIFACAYMYATWR